MSDPPLRCTVDVHRPEDDVHPVNLVHDPYALPDDQPFAACTECHRFLVAEAQDYARTLHQLWWDSYPTDLW